MLGYRGLIVGMTGDPPGCDDRVHFETSGVDVCVDKGAHAIRRVKQLLANALDAHAAASADVERIGGE